VRNGDFLIIYAAGYLEDSGPDNYFILGSNSITRDDHDHDLETSCTTANASSSSSTLTTATLSEEKIKEGLVEKFQQHPFVSSSASSNAPRKTVPVKEDITLKDDKQDNLDIEQSQSSSSQSQPTARQNLNQSTHQNQSSSSQQQTHSQRQSQNSNFLSRRSISHRPTVTVPPSYRYNLGQTGIRLNSSSIRNPSVPVSSNGRHVIPKASSSTSGSLSARSLINPVIQRLSCSRGRPTTNSNSSQTHAKAKAVHRTARGTIIGSASGTSSASGSATVPCHQPKGTSLGSGSATVPVHHPTNASSASSSTSIRNDSMDNQVVQQFVSQQRQIQSEAASAESKSDSVPLSPSPPRPAVSVTLPPINICQRNNSPSSFINTTHLNTYAYAKPSSMEDQSLSDSESRSTWQTRITRTQKISIGDRVIVDNYYGTRRISGVVRSHNYIYGKY